MKESKRKSAQERLLCVLSSCLSQIAEMLRCWNEKWEVKQRGVSSRFSSFIKRLSFHWPSMACFRRSMVCTKTFITAIFKKSTLFTSEDVLRSGKFQILQTNIADIVVNATVNLSCCKVKQTKTKYLSCMISLTVFLSFIYLTVIFAILLHIHDSLGLHI